MSENPSSALLSIPKHFSLIDHFDSLDCFEKRALINELKDIVRADRKNLRVVHACFALSVCGAIIYSSFYFYWWYVITILLLNIPSAVMMVRKKKSIGKYEAVIAYLEYRLV
jgi:hypothetical protein